MVVHLRQRQILAQEPIVRRIAGFVWSSVIFRVSILILGIVFRRSGVGDGQSVDFECSDVTFSWNRTTRRACVRHMWPPMTFQCPLDVYR